MEHFSDAFELGEADAVLAASLFHFGEITIPELKAYLQKKRYYSQKIIKIPGSTFPGIFIDRKGNSFCQMILVNISCDNSLPKFASFSALKVLRIPFL